MKIRIPYIFQYLTDGIKTVETEGQTVGGCLNTLQDKLPGIKPRLFDEKGQPYKYVGLYLNNSKISNGLNLPVKDEDELLILVVIYGR